MSKLGSSVNGILSEMQEAKRQGDNNALNYGFKELFSLCHKDLLTAVKFLFVVKEDAKDCIMEMYGKIFQYIHSFTPEDDGYNWLLTTAINIGCDMNKKQYPQTSLEDVLFALCSSTPTEEQQILKMDLKNAIDQLSPKKRKVVYYRFYEDETLDTCDENYRVLLYHALKKD